MADDGIGPPGPGETHGHGLKNMGIGAARLGGRLELRAGELAGTALEWRVPLE